MSAASVWDAREALHVRRAVSGAELHGDPSPYVYVENVFSPQTYSAMCRLFPSGSALRRWQNPGAAGTRFGAYDRRRETHVPAEAERLPAAQREFWLAASSFLHGSDFARTLLDRFEPYARERFGDRIDDPSFVRDRLGGTLILSQHDAGYYLGPHTDRSERVFTCLFYLPERDGLDHLGTTLYRPLEPGFTCGGLAHHDPARFERRATMPYRANSALMFARTDVMFHGVHALSAEQLQGSRRRSIQMQFWVHNARPREACKTTLRASVPAQMRLGADEAIAFRLTNRASDELHSGLPYATQLGYRWYDADGREAEPDARVRTALPRPIGAGETVDGSMRVVAPRASGRYVLRLSLVQEGVAWFDDIDSANGTSAHVSVHDVEAPAASARPAPRAAMTDGPSDIVAQSNDLALGGGWYPVERAGTDAFRWVENDAVVHVAALRPMRHTLRVVAEPGPGVGLRPFTLAARLADGREIGTAVVAGKQTVAFALPPESPGVFSITLHALGGGTASFNDPRVLNFRVFSIAIDRTDDVFPAWAEPASGFYPPERQDGELFRWVGGDATVKLHSARRDVLEFDAESGPGMQSKPFELRVVASDGAELARAQICSRTRVRVPLRDASGAESVLLRARGGGAAVSGDPRVLDFRVFAPQS